MTRPGGDDLPFVFSGTLIVQGQGIAQVWATGIHTEMGNIGKALQTVEVEGTRLQKEIGQLVRRAAILGFASAKTTAEACRATNATTTHRQAAEEPFKVVLGRTKQTHRGEVARNITGSHGEAPCSPLVHYGIVSHRFIISRYSRQTREVPNSTDRQTCRKTNRCLAQSS